VRGWFIPGVSPIAVCDVHREVLVDAITGLRRWREDETHPVRREVFEFWPGDVLTLFAQAGVRRRVPPPFVDGDGGGVASRVGRAPVIVSPRAGTRYQLRSDTVTGRQLTLQVSCESGVRRVFWFVDRVFLGAASPSDPFLCSLSGKERSLRVVDDQGRSASCPLTLEWVR
jgi:penicillin-binding protein 1C